MTEQIIEVTLPVILKLVASILGIVAAYCVNEFKKFIIAKIGEVNYNKAYSVAIGLYVMLEDEFGPGTGEDKAEEMAARLHELFPQLSETELVAINKAVWEEFNLKYSATVNEIEDLNEGE